MKSDGGPGLPGEGGEGGQRDWAGLNGGPIRDPNTHYGAL